MIVELHDQFPRLSAVVVQSAPETESVTVTVLFASAVPLKLGVASLVDAPPTGEAMTGAEGATVSIVRPRTVDGPLVFPALSVASAVILCGPSPRTTREEQVQFPRLSANAVQSAPSTLSVTVTLLNGSAVPAKFGVVSLVELPFAGDVNTGTAGAVVSTVRLTAVDGVLLFPALSVATARTL